MALREYAEMRPRLGLSMLRRMATLAKPFWVSEQKWKAIGLAALLGLLLAGYTWSNILFNHQTGEFTSSLAARDANRFWRSILLFLGLLVVAVPIYAYYYYYRDKLVILWRRWLTDRLLGGYFDNRAYYQLLGHSEIDNPDQRIAQDIASFTQQFLSFLLLFASASFELVAFSGVLWSISKPLVLFLVLYAAFGTLVTTGLFSGKMISLYFDRLRKEADLRFGLVRVRENAESIALYQGEQREQAQIELRFGEVFENYNHLIRWGLRLNLFSYTYSFLALAVPSIVIAPRVLSGELEVGRVVQASGAFSAILSALTLLVNNLESLSGFAASIGRLDAFIEILERASHSKAGYPRIETREGDRIEFQHVTLKTPDQARTLVEDLDLSVAPGEGLVIVGPSGCGKSSMLRAIAGLRDEGQGTIVRPTLKDLLFLPQQPYMILGTLRQQLCYPRLEIEPTDEELLSLLEQVNLGNLAERCGGLSGTLDFGKVLSVGERQRLSFARALLNQPQYVLLDEATSALDRENEVKLYQLLAGSRSTMVSVSHRPALVKFHSQVLELTGNGGWRRCPAASFQFSVEHV